jgi:catechol 2,3-dioxygenase-like lactoylglutathione lyase family enzyme
MPRVTGVLETCLYVDDLERAAQFYEKLFHFRRLVSEERLCAFSVGDDDVLILFLRGSTFEPVTLPGGVIPPHDGSGHLHFALAIAAEDVRAWEQRLGELGIRIESRVKWSRGGESLYFRDPDGHLVELATPGIWANHEARDRA